MWLAKHNFRLKSLTTTGITLNYIEIYSGESGEYVPQLFYIELKSDLVSEH